MREPSVSLLVDAGFGPEEPGDCALAFPCRNAPVDVLLVRADDIPEYVQDGVVDCGITGADLVAERGARVTELLRLGFGGCTLEAAVPEESQVGTLGELAGLRVATVYPRLTARLLAERGVSVELVDVTGSVEVAPRLGLADAIVDLVSSGNTLRTNGLRSLGPLFASEAVLVAGEAPDEASQRLRPILASVVQARPSVRHPLPVGEGWLVVGVNDQYEWQKPLDGLAWPGHYIVLELRLAPITRAVRHEVEETVAKVEAMLPSLSYVDRTEILKRASVSLEGLVGSKRRHVMLSRSS